MQRSYVQGFDGLDDDLVVGYLRDLSLPLQKLLAKIGECLLLSLSTQQEVFLYAEFCLEPLEIEQ
jgi:hypothetical protein